MGSFSPLGVSISHIAGDTDGMDVDAVVDFPSSSPGLAVELIVVEEGGVDDIVLMMVLFS